jgi:pSer/pThr/pTyr-binding forkhead associated (FHA) protein
VCCDPAGWTIADEGSSNGTLVAGRYIAPGMRQVLADGDEIRIGPVILVFRAGAPAPADRTRVIGADDRTVAADPRHGGALPGDYRRGGAR